MDVVRSLQFKSAGNLIWVSICMIMMYVYLHMHFTVQHQYHMYRWWPDGRTSSSITIWAELVFLFKQWLQHAWKTVKTSHFCRVWQERMGEMYSTCRVSNGYSDNRYDQMRLCLIYCMYKLPEVYRQGLWSILQTLHTLNSNSGVLLLLLLELYSSRFNYSFSFNY